MKEKDKKNQKKSQGGKAKPFRTGNKKNAMLAGKPRKKGVEAEQAMKARKSKSSKKQPKPQMGYVEFREVAISSPERREAPKVPQGTKVAVLIDAENCSVKYLPIIMEKAAEYGEIAEKKAYGNWASSHLTGWMNASVSQGIIQVHQPFNGKGKSSSDFALVVDAMDMLYRRDYDVFVIATSDSDFTRLVTRMHEDGKKVVLAGESKTSVSLTVLVDEFVALDDIRSERLQEAREQAEVRKQVPAMPSKAKGRATIKTVTAVKVSEKTKPAKSKAPKPKSAAVVEVVARDNGNVDRDGTDAHRTPRRTRQRADDIQARIVEIIAEFADDDGWTDLCAIGHNLKQDFPDFSPSQFGYKKLADLVRSLESIEERRVASSDPMSPQLFFRCV